MFGRSLQEIVRVSRCLRAALVSSYMAAIAASSIESAAAFVTYCLDAAPKPLSSSYEDTQLPII